MCIQLTELNLSLERVDLKLSFCGNYMWRFQAIWGQWRKRKYLRLKTRQNHFQKLVCDVCLQQTEFNVSFHRAVWKHSLCKVCKWIFGPLWRPSLETGFLHIMLDRRILSNFFVCVYSTHRAEPSFRQSRFATLVLWNLHVEISSELRSMTEKEISSFKN